MALLELLRKGEVDEGVDFLRDGVRQAVVTSLAATTSSS